jgi:hypothetical protein
MLSLANAGARQRRGQQRSEQGRSAIVSKHEIISSLPTFDFLSAYTPKNTIGRQDCLRRLLHAYL